jgi:hypothetical protein
MAVVPVAWHGLSDYTLALVDRVLLNFDTLGFPIFNRGIEHIITLPL